MFYVHEEFPDHEKLDRVRDSDPALYIELVGFWLVSGCDSRKRLSDGRMTIGRLERVSGLGKRARVLADMLVSMRLWECVEGGGYSFHDWADVQETKDLVKSRRFKWRNAKRSKRSTDEESVTGDVCLSTVESQADSALESHSESEPDSPLDSKADSPLESPTNRRGMDLRSQISISSADSRSIQKRPADFNSKDLTALFSQLRKGVGGGTFRAQQTDYDRLQSAVAWALEESPNDPATVCRLGIEKFLRYATGREADGWHFWGWANDPGRWLAYVPPTFGNLSQRRAFGASAISTRAELAEAAKNNPAWLDDPPANGVGK